MRNMSSQKKLAVTASASEWTLHELQSLNQVLGPRNRNMKKSTTTQPTVMVVDDSDEYRSVLKLWLQTKGYQVIEASDGEEALLNASQEQPDLILMDIGMPNQSGISATYRIRKNPILRDIPIIAITGFTAKDLHQDALKAGCIECLTKPVDVPHLADLIERSLRGRS